VDRHGDVVDPEGMTAISYPLPSKRAQIVRADDGVQAISRQRTPISDAATGLRAYAQEVERAPLAEAEVRESLVTACGRA